MQQVDHYMRQAKAARALAKDAKTQTARSQFEGIAEGWEKLARERLAFLESKDGAMNGNAPVDGVVQSMSGNAIRLDRQ